MNPTDIVLFVDEKLLARLKAAASKSSGASPEEIIQICVSSQLGAGGDIGVAPLKPTKRNGCHRALVSIAPGQTQDHLLQMAADLTAASMKADGSLTAYSKAYILDRLLDAELAAMGL